MISARKNKNDMAIAIESLVVRLILYSMISAKEFYEKRDSRLKQTMVGMLNAVTRRVRESWCFL
jgi:hypothetical protein